MVVKCRNRSSQVMSSISSKNEVLNGVKKISSPLHMPKHRLSPSSTMVIMPSAGPTLMWDNVTFV
jgi:hypothetical protein